MMRQLIDFLFPQLFAIRRCGQCDVAWRPANFASAFSYVIEPNCKHDWQASQDAAAKGAE